MPKVSVIIPTYNRLSMLKEAVDSVLAQDFEDFELIVVDDGSTDGTADEVIRYGGRVKLLQHGENRGVSAARNSGILHAKGKYIAFLDSDDLWVKGKIEESRLPFWMRTPIIPFATPMRSGFEEGRGSTRCSSMPNISGWIFEKCLPLCTISPSSAMMRKTLFSRVGLFDEALPVCEDYDLWLRVSARFPIFFIDKKLIIKRGGHPDQLSNRSWGNDRFRVMALEKLLSEPSYRVRKRGTLVLKEMKKKCQILSRGFLKRGNELEGKRYQEIMKQYGIEI